MSALPVPEFSPAIRNADWSLDGDYVPMVGARKIAASDVSHTLRGTYGPIEYALNNLCLRRLQYRLVKAAAAIAEKANQK